MLHPQLLIPIIEKKVVPDSIVYSDCWRGYNVLDVSEFKHYRINHSKLFADRKNHINGIENFWNQAKRHMRKFNGVPKEHFGLFLKECEWRFNNPDPKAQLSQIKQWVRKYLTQLSRVCGHLGFPFGVISDSSIQNGGLNERAAFCVVGCLVATA